MPATEQTWRNLKTLHVVFGASALIMLLITVWLLAADHNREAKGLQKQFGLVETRYLEWRRGEQLTTDYETKQAELEKQLRDARAEVPARDELDAALKPAIAQKQADPKLYNYDIDAVERAYRWKTDRGLAIVKTAIVSIEYDANTREILKTVQRADALAGARGNSNLQASVAAGIQAAGENAGVGGIVGMGVATGGLGGLAGLQQPAAAAPQTAPAPAADDPIARLTQAKKMLDAGLITQSDYDAVKAKALGL